MKRIISLMLVMVMLLSFSGGAFAEVVSNRSSGIKYEIKMLDGTVLTQEEFIQYLYDNQDKITGNEAGKNKNGIKLEQSNGRPDAITTASYAAPIGNGTYYVKGIGEVVIEFGKFIVAGVIVKSGTWLYDKIVEWIEARAEKKEIEDAKSKIPSRLKDRNGEVDLGKFNQKVKGRTAYKESGGWEIDKDRDGHKGSEWKLKSPKDLKRGPNTRTASLDKNGRVVGE